MALCVCWLLWCCCDVCMTVGKRSWAQCDSVFCLWSSWMVNMSFLYMYVGLILDCYCRNTAWGVITISYSSCLLNHYVPWQVLKTVHMSHTYTVMILASQMQDMLHNYATWGGLEAYWRGVTVTNFLGVKMEKKTLRKQFGGCQRIISSMHRWRKVICCIIMPIGVA